MAKPHPMAKRGMAIPTYGRGGPLAIPHLRTGAYMAKGERCLPLRPSHTYGCLHGQREGGWGRASLFGHPLRGWVPIWPKGRLGSAYMAKEGCKGALRPLWPSPKGGSLHGQRRGWDGPYGHPLRERRPPFGLWERVAAPHRLPSALRGVLWP
jgi:hypothetical protein